jgi:hypothetical protein
VIDFAGGNLNRTSNECASQTPRAPTTLKPNRFIVNVGFVTSINWVPALILSA